MIRLIVLAALIASAAAAATCELPAALTGQWDSNVAGWTSLTITNTTISTLKPESRNLTFSCDMNNGTTYVIKSTPLSVAGKTYNYYTCLDIVPSATSTDIVFFRIRTKNNENHNNQPFHTFFTGEETFEGICDRNATEFPLGYTMFLRKGYKNNLGNETCPGSLQGVFSANFTDSIELTKCPEGFELNGCDHSHITFNYTQCGSGSNLASSGSPVYMCLTSVKKGDVTYTLVQEASQQQPNPYRYACLAQEKGQDGQMNVTKSANVCGGSPSVDMEATETVSCRSPAPATTEAPPGSGNSTQASFNTTQGNSTGGGGQGNGGGGDGNSCSFASWGILSFFLPALISVLLAGKM